MGDHTPQNIHLQNCWQSFKHQIEKCATLAQHLEKPLITVFNILTMNKKNTNLYANGNNLLEHIEG